MERLSQYKLRTPKSLTNAGNSKIKVPIFFSIGTPPLEQIKMAIQHPLDF